MVDAGAVAPAGAAPGSDAVGAAVQEPLVAGGGGGRPGVGAPQSGARGTQSGSEAPGGELPPPTILPLPEAAWRSVSRRSGRSSYRSISTPEAVLREPSWVSIQTLTKASPSSQTKAPNHWGQGL